MGSYSHQPKECDLCHNPFGFKNTKFFVDGATKMGMWAIMCDACHKYKGCGLGTGRGQRYNHESLQKVG